MRLRIGAGLCKPTQHVTHYVVHLNRGAGECVSLVSTKCPLLFGYGKKMIVLGVNRKRHSFWESWLVGAGLEGTFRKVLDGPGRLL